MISGSIRKSRRTGLPSRRSRAASSRAFWPSVSGTTEDDLEGRDPLPLVPGLGGRRHDRPAGSPGARARRGGGRGGRSSPRRPSSRGSPRRCPPLSGRSGTDSPGPRGDRPGPRRGRRTSSSSPRTRRNSASSARAPTSPSVYLSNERGISHSAWKASRWICRRARPGPRVRATCGSFPGRSRSRSRRRRS